MADGERKKTLGKIVMKHSIHFSSTLNAINLHLVCSIKIRDASAVRYAFQDNALRPLRDSTHVFFLLTKYERKIVFLCKLWRDYRIEM